MIQTPEDKNSWSLRFIRQAIRDHVISFPSQVPVFRHLHRPDIQWRIVLLYFVHGWSSVKIASRYGITRERVVQLLRQWAARAILRGYLDRIPKEPELLS
jgi:hypothetical protein